MGNENDPAWHENPTQFREALNYTASRTGFLARLIEKDYYGSLVLRELGPLFSAGLIFKGGTALSKVHAGFHRLSEDLDFSVSIAVDASRAERRAAIEPVKHSLRFLTARLPWLTVVQPLKGADVSKHYTAAYSYRSCLADDDELLKLEIGLREPVVDAAGSADARTMLLDPFKLAPAIN